MGGGLNDLCDNGLEVKILEWTDVFLTVDEAEYTVDIL